MVGQSESLLDMATMHQGATLPLTQGAEGYRSKEDLGQSWLRAVRTWSSADEAVERFANVVCAAFLSIPAGLVILPVYVLYLLTLRHSGPFLYKGVRMGKGKRLFHIYKIRTLVNDAEKQIGAALHSPNRGRELWYGGFLRNTRIDELPQLWNIIKGDMDFVGPRPVRPLLYHTSLCHVCDYDRRFDVRPGLTGYAQFHTPHGAPARLRALIDSRFIRLNRGLWRKGLFIGVTALSFLVRLTREMVGTTRRAVARQMNRVECERRAQPRVVFSRRKQRDLWCDMHIMGLGVRDGTVPVHLLNINHDCMLVQVTTPCNLADDRVRLRIVRRRRKRGRTRYEVVKCAGEVQARYPADTHKASAKVVIRYKPDGEWDRYKLLSYVLQETYGA